MRCMRKKIIASRIQRSKMEEQYFVSLMNKGGQKKYMDDLVYLFTNY